MKVLEVLFQRVYKEFEYIYRKELIDMSEINGEEPLEMINCYTLKGDWIGGAKEAKFLCKKLKLTDIQKTEPEHCVCSIGFNKAENKWYGWSHRACYGFGIGDMLFKEKFASEENETTPFNKIGKKEIVNLTQAKQAAINFAQYVS